jgi:iron-sulfur cluster repair protein YtfE (RIC family)
MTSTPPADTDALEHRDGLPSAFRYLEADCPRANWATMGIHPMAQHWLEIHGWFRGQMNELGQIGGFWREGRIGAADYRAHATPRVRHLLSNLHHHHTLESEHAFPQLAAAEPRMAAGFDLLDRDHDAIERLMAAMAEAANDLVRGGGAPLELPGLAHALTDRLERGTALIVSHLDDEEEIVVPVLTLSAHDLRL